MRYPLTVESGPWQPQRWQEVYFEDGTDVLLDLADAMDDGRLDNLVPYVNKLGATVQGKWRLSPSMAIPVLIDLCEHVVADEPLDLTPYQARLAMCAGIPGQVMTFPMDLFNMLVPHVADGLLKLGPVRLVA
jgi:hypothetical protein